MIDTIVRDFSASIDIKLLMITSTSIAHDDD